jgi:hypothetical protein
MINMSSAKQRAAQRMMPDTPQVGDTVYVNDADVVHQTYVRGGRATVSAVYLDGGRVWVRVAEMTGDCWAWDYLGPMQNDLRSLYGDIRAGKYIMRPEDTQDAEPGAAPDPASL